MTSPFPGARFKYSIADYSITRSGHPDAPMSRCMYNSIRELMKRMREILLNEYIGAITIGLLLAQALGGVISTILQPMITYLENRSRPSSIFAPAPSIFNWPSLIINFISIILHLLVAFLLFMWLYGRGDRAPATAVQPATPQASSTPEEPRQS